MLLQFSKQSILHCPKRKNVGVVAPKKIILTADTELFEGSKQILYLTVVFCFLHTFNPADLAKLPLRTILHKVSD